MRRLNLIKILALAGLLGLGLLPVLPFEPTYHGKDLTFWLRQGRDTPTDETQKVAEAHEAINSIGARKALPRLLKMAKAEDSAIRSWMINQMERRDVHLVKMEDAGMIRQLAVEGFEALGTNGAPAVEALTGLLEDPDRSFSALQCLIYIGKPAERSVCVALTNRYPHIRRFAAAQLACVTDEIDLFMVRLKVSLSDSDTSVRFAAVQALGLQTEYPEEAIPLLMGILKDPEESVAGSAASFLGDFGTNGLRAFKDLSDMVEQRPRLAHSALKSMMAIAPGRTLPLMLNQMHSPEARKRSQAISVLGRCKPTEQIIAALKPAMEDSDTKVANYAVTVLTRFREEDRQKGGSPVVIPGEPIFAGKGLHEWLRRPQNGTVSEESQKVVRQMGTNAVPALFDMLFYRDPKFGVRDIDVSGDATVGFMVLGEQAKAALPRLEALIDGPDARIAVFALTSTASMGKESVGVMIRALTNRFEDVRCQAAALIGQELTQPFPEDRKKAIPALEALLKDPSEIVRENAVNALREIRSGGNHQSEGKMRGLE